MIIVSFYFELFNTFQTKLLKFYQTFNFFHHWVVRNFLFYFKGASTSCHGKVFSKRSLKWEASAKHWHILWWIYTSHCWWKLLFVNSFKTLWLWFPQSSRKHFFFPVKRREKQFLLQMIFSWKNWLGNKYHWMFNSEASLSVFLEKNKKTIIRLEEKKFRIARNFSWILVCNEKKWFPIFDSTGTFFSILFVCIEKGGKKKSHILFSIYINMKINLHFFRMVKKWRAKVWVNLAKIFISFRQPWAY